MNMPCIASVDFRIDEAYVDKINVEAIVQAETNVAGHPNEGKIRRCKSFVMSAHRQEVYKSQLPQLRRDLFQFAYRNF